MLWNRKQEILPTLIDNVVEIIEKLNRFWQLRGKDKRRYFIMRTEVQNFGMELHVS